MSNYSETVIIPFFQKKISELQSFVTVLEANYIVEQHKNKELSEKINEILDSKNNASKDLESQIMILKSELSNKNSEINRASDVNSSLNRKLDDLKRVISKLEQDIFGLQDSNIKLTEENSKLNENIKTVTSSTAPVRKKRIKEVVLDGSTF